MDSDGAKPGFEGAKLMLFIGARLLVIRRDHSVGIPFPGYLDFPGGGRDGSETPVECVLRETSEEVGLTLTEQQLLWRCPFDNVAGRRSWFFAAQEPEAVAYDVRFGNEGEGWCLIPPREYLGRKDAIPHFQKMLKMYLDT